MLQLTTYLLTLPSLSSNCYRNGVYIINLYNLLSIIMWQQNSFIISQTLSFQILLLNVTTIDNNQKDFLETINGFDLLDSNFECLSQFLKKTIGFQLVLPYWKNYWGYAWVIIKLFHFRFDKALKISIQFHSICMVPLTCLTWHIHRYRKMRCEFVCVSVYVALPSLGAGI